MLKHLPEKTAITFGSLALFLTSIMGMTAELSFAWLGARVAIGVGAFTVLGYAFGRVFENVLSDALSEEKAQRGGAHGAAPQPSEAQP